MLEKTVIVGLKNGLDAGAIASLVQKACHFECKVYLEAEGKKINAKSIMGMMNVGVQKGKEITIITDGSDAQEAQDALVEFIAG